MFTTMTITVKPQITTTDPTIKVIYADATITHKQQLNIDFNKPVWKVDFSHKNNGYYVNLK